MICINMRVSKWWYFIYLFIWLNYRISSPNWKFCHQRVYLNAFDTLIHNCLALENWTDNCFMLLCKHSHCDSTFNAAYIHTSLCQIRTKFSIMRCDNMLSAETDPFCCVMKHISSLLTLPCKRERERVMCQWDISVQSNSLHWIIGRPHVPQCRWCNYYESTHTHTQIQMQIWQENAHPYTCMPM